MTTSSSNRRSQTPAARTRSRAIPYPKPRETGGKLLRALVGGMRAAGLSLPLIDTDILIAASGGADSTALAVALARYGRRVCGSGSRVRLLHINHGWRGARSDADARWVVGLARRLGVAACVEVAERPPPAGSGRSWEEHARAERKRVFRAQVARSRAEGRQALVLTGHQRDDLAETVVWRWLSGAPDELAGGILRRFGDEVRPWLSVSRAELRAFLREEGVGFRADATNRDTRFLRARLRHRVLPLLEREFPGLAERLARAALARQSLPPKRAQSERSSDGADSA